MVNYVKTQFDTEKGVEGAIALFAFAAGMRYEARIRELMGTETP